MIRAVVDTNILVSALLSPSGAPARVFDHVLNGNVIMCFDSRIIAEYQEVLARPKFKFDPKTVSQVIDFILHTGMSLVPEPLTVEFEDEDDKAFYEVAISAKSHLVTGNVKHFSKDPIVVTAQEFLEIIERQKQF
ncbi:MAG: putative toxin-antitoxin system toxin component, PIN family [Bacillota bacterium]